MAWSLYGLLTSQFGDVQQHLKLADGVNTVPVYLYLKNQFGYRHEFLGVVAFMVVGFALMFSVIFALAMRTFRFQKR